MPHLSLAVLQGGILALAPFRQDWVCPYCPWRISDEMPAVIPEDERHTWELAYRKASDGPEAHYEVCPGRDKYPPLAARDVYHKRRPAPEGG